MGINVYVNCRPDGLGVWARLTPLRTSLPPAKILKCYKAAFLKRPTRREREGSKSSMNSSSSSPAATRHHIIIAGQQVVGKMSSEKVTFCIYCNFGDDFPHSVSHSSSESPVSKLWQDRASFSARRREPKTKLNELNVTWAVGRNSPLWRNRDVWSTGIQSKLRG